MDFKALKVDHLGIAVNSIKEALPFYTNGLQLEVVHREEIADQKVITAFLPVGETLIELLEPTSPDSPIAKYLEKRGPGIHHVAYGVDNIEAALAHAKAAGYRLIDEQPRPGGHGKMIAFLHPKDSFGVLTEFCQKKDEGEGH